jgi:hypothetical protein
MINTLKFALPPTLRGKLATAGVSAVAADDGAWQTWRFLWHCLHPSLIRSFLVFYSALTFATLATFSTSEAEFAESH